MSLILIHSSKHFTTDCERKFVSPAVFKRNFYFPGVAGTGSELGHVKGKGVTQLADQSWEESGRSSE